MGNQLQPCTIAVLLAGGLPGFSETPAKPDIVVIVADDLGYGSLRCYGDAEVCTPNLDRLAESGVRFTDFHGNGAMCSPARAAIMTGRYQLRCAWVEDVNPSPVFREQREANPRQRWARGIANEEITMPRLLRQTGYRTALIGKWHPGCDFKCHPMNFGFAEFRGYVGGNVDYRTHIAGYGTNELDRWRDKQPENESVGTVLAALRRHQLETSTLCGAVFEPGSPLAAPPM